MLRDPIGVFFLIVLLGALASLAAAGAARAASRASRRRRIALAIPLGLACGTFAWGHFVETRWVVTTRTRVTWRGPKLRAVVIGDLHAGHAPRALVERTVRHALAAEPDIVFLVGDYVSGYDAVPEKLAILDPLRRLHAPLGVYAVLGNHDSEPYGTNTPRAGTLAQLFTGMGFTVLRNASHAVLPGLTVVGLDDSLSGHVDPAQAFAQVPAEGARIALTHEWQGLRRPGMGRFDLGLAGHTHGGQICVPFTGYCPFSKKDAPYVEGLFPWPAGGQLFVTRGIGVSAILARLACRPEVAVLEIGP